MPLWLVKSGDEIIVPEPAYANYMAFAVSAGAIIKTIPTSIDTGFKLPEIEKFEALIHSKTKGILICNPNNPTGYVYTAEEMEQIRLLVKKHNLYLFSDEVYREFIYSDAPYISACHLKDIEENVVLIDSVSKRYSECGIRIGCDYQKINCTHGDEVLSGTVEPSVDWTNCRKCFVTGKRSVHAAKF